MSRKLLCCCIAILCTFATLAAAATNWKHPLSLDGGGYWAGRIRVVVKNGMPRAVAGEPAAVRIGNAPGEAQLIGQRAEAVRVCNEQGEEMLLAVEGPEGDVISRGAIPAGSALALPVECAAQQSAIYYLYFDNPHAGEVPDVLAAKFGAVNGSVEHGDGEAPTGWSHDPADTNHRASWTTENPQSGKRCLKIAVDADAQPTWISTRQGGIHIVGGAKYRLRAWVKAQNAKGRIGWYVHVGTAEKPMLLCPDLAAGEGTFDWKELTGEFVAPPEANLADLGTMLYGTGTAWFDNVHLECLEPSRLLTVAEKPERLTLASVGNDTAWSGSLPGPVGMWDRRATVRAFNFSSEAATSRVVPIDATMFDARTPGGVAKYVLVTDAGKPIPCQRIGTSLFLNADIPPRTVRTWRVYWCAAPRMLAKNIDIPHNAIDTGTAPFPGNLLKNPDFAAGHPLPADWTSDPLPPNSGIQLALEDSDRPSVGKRCLKMHVPRGAPAEWRGCRQNVPVRPNRTYLVSAWLKCKDLSDGEVAVYVHRIKADGGLSKQEPFTEAGSRIRDTTDWTRLSGLVTTPEDTTSLGIHLTTNLSGTVWYAGVSVVEVEPARWADVEGQPLKNADDLKLWPVPAVVKVFQDDPPPQEDRPFRISAARNELEPLQLAICSGRALRGVRVEVDSPLGPNGAKLADCEVNVVGYVPIDYPTNYYQSKSPAWHRKVPTEPIGCDGWAGRWPDPLLPNHSFDLAANTTQPVWITVTVPKDAAAGEYTGTVRLVADGRPLAQQPFTVRVRNFTLPDESHVMAKFETGPGDGWRWWGKSWDEVYPEIVSFMAKRRVCPRGVWPDPVLKYENGRVTADFAEFDRGAERYFHEFTLSFAWMPQCFYVFGWGLPPAATFGDEPYPGKSPFDGADRAKLRPEYKRSYQACLKAFWDHVKEKGWEKKFVLYISDEPFYTQPHIVQQMKALCQMIHEVDPRIPIYASTWKHVPEWDGAINVWGLGHYGIVPTEQLAKLRTAGDRIWWTTDGQMCTDTPYCAVERLLPHYCFKYGVEAYEFWSICWTTYNPHRFGWHAYIFQSDQPGVSYWVRYPNGDGFLMYPGHPLGLSGPISTIRLEQAREGVEDYEYLYLLRQLIAKAKSVGKDTSAAERAMARAARLVTIPNAGGRYSSKILASPDELYVVRDELGEAIESLGR